MLKLIDICLERQNVWLNAAAGLQPATCVEP
jgi:hypothetical protein